MKTQTRTPIYVQIRQPDPVLDWIGHEACLYLERLTGRKPVLLPAGQEPPVTTGVVRLEVAPPDPRPGPAAQDRERDSFADGIQVRAGSGSVRLSGTNPRSVLFALYRWLEELGCRWLRPGPMGEFVPRIDHPLERRIRLNETPSYRHRCICIEGSCSRQHVLDMLDYAAKRGFNAYFLQFRDSYTFFDHWYRFERHAGAPPTPFTAEHAAAIHREVKQAALQRGLSLHTVGHGWTCEPFGIAGREWQPTRQAISPAVKKYFAQIRGRRELWHGVPLNTQLCYAHPTVQRLMAQAVVDYAGAHPEETVIHVWLADGANNNCECPACRKHRPSDLYVRILNRIDRMMTARKLSARIVFLAYVDLLWAPQREKIAHPDRFILMFAPITRSYSKPFGLSSGVREKAAPFIRNKLVFPQSPQANLDRLKEWRRAFTGECVDFDYHLWRDWFYDPGQMQISRVIYEDARNLAAFGMNGYISCQAQRLAFPTGLPLHVLGKTLWDANQSHDRLTRDYFRDLYGRESDLFRRHLEKISRLFDPPFLRGEKKSPADIRQAARNYASLSAYIRTFEKRLRPIRSTDPAMRYTARLQRHHAWYAGQLARLYTAVTRQDPAAGEELARLESGLNERLMELHPVLDTWMVRGMARHIVGCAGLRYREKIWAE